jgi:hypothetical protein
LAFLFDGGSVPHDYIVVNRPDIILALAFSTIATIGDAEQAVYLLNNY